MHFFFQSSILHAKLKKFKVMTHFMIKERFFINFISRKDRQKLKVFNINKFLY